MITAMLTPKCKFCGKRYPMFMEDEVPAMLGFVQADGKTINVCKFCIEKIGAMNEQERAEFFEEHGIQGGLNE